ncbi:hypothetical protein [Planococcus sp. YIM B11945]|uniref:hypothetical protein n=1 Tax=Planococcus sp. YIM B11945 TaxID=3435410 RepID=UPI003D7E77E7
MAFEVHVPTDALNDYGYLDAFITLENSGDRVAVVNEGDFALYKKASDAKFDIAIDFVGADGKPFDVALEPYELAYVFGSFDMSGKKPAGAAINLEEYEMRYLGDAKVKEDSVAVQLDLENKFPDLVGSSSSVILSASTVDAIPLNADGGLFFTVYGPLDDKTAYVRVENATDKKLSFDPANLYVYDSTKHYGIDPNAANRAVEGTITLKPGEIVDYSEVFLLENASYENMAEIDQNLFGAMYSPEDAGAVYGIYYADEALPEDFGDYE